MSRKYELGGPATESGPPFTDPRNTYREDDGLDDLRYDSHGFSGHTAPQTIECQLLSISNALVGVVKNVPFPPHRTLMRHEADGSLKAFRRTGYVVRGSGPTAIPMIAVYREDPYAP